MCHTPLMIGISRVNVGAFSTHLITHLLLWLSTSIWEAVSSPTWEGRNLLQLKDEIYRIKFSAVRVLQKVWPALNLVNAWSNWVENLWEVRFWKAVLFGTEIEVKGLTNLLLRWLLACCPALTFSGQHWLFWSWLGLTRLLIGGLLWHMLGWLTKETLLVEASCWPP